MRKKSLLLILILTLAVVLCSCSPVKFEDIYINHSSLAKYDGYEELGKLPVNCTVAYNDNNFIDPFFENHTWVVVKNNSKLAVYDYKNSSFVVGGGASTSDYKYRIKKNENFVFSQESSSSNVVVTETSNMQSFEVNNNNMADIVIPSNNSEYFFVDQEDNYEIYNKTGMLQKIGKTHSIGDKSYRIDTITVVDKTIVANSGRGCAMFFPIPTEKVEGNALITLRKNSAFTASSGIWANGIGDNKFYIFEQNNSYSEDYDYIITNNGYKNKYTGKAYIYNAVEDKVEKEIVDNKYYKSIVSTSDDSYKNQMGDLKVTIDDIFNDGYKFVDDAFYIDKNTKEATVDQFIINDKNEVVVSLSGKISGDINLNKDKLSNLSPLMLLFVDGKGVSPNANWKDIRLMNIDGTTAFEKKGQFKDLYYNNDALVCRKFGAKEIAGAINNERYGAFDKKGKQIVDFKYDYMTPFISEYALAYDIYIKDDADNLIRYNEVYLKEGLYYRPDGTALPVDFKPGNAEKKYKVYRVDKSGNEMLVEDMAETPVKNILVFKVGAYVSKNDNGTFNVKNNAGEKIFNENFKTVVINKPNLDDVTICGTKDNQVHIYKLTASTKGLPESKSIYDIIIPTTVVGAIVIIAVVVVVVVKTKKIKKSKVAVSSNEGLDKEQKAQATKENKKNKNK